MPRLTCDSSCSLWNSQNAKKLTRGSHLGVVFQQESIASRLSNGVIIGCQKWQPNGILFFSSASLYLQLWKFTFFPTRLRRCGCIFWRKGVLFHFVIWHWSCIVKQCNGQLNTNTILVYLHLQIDQSATEFLNEGRGNAVVWGLLIASSKRLTFTFWVKVEKERVSTFLFTPKTSKVMKLSFKVCSSGL